MRIMKLVLLIVFTTGFQIYVFAQNEGMQLGSNINSLRNSTQGGYFDYSDPQAINIKVSVWGFVKYPGKYVVPEYSNVNDLISFAGGPSDAARLENLRLMRTNKDSSQEIADVNYKDVLMDLTSHEVSKSPALQPGDVLLVTGEPRYYFKDYLSMGISILSAVISITTLLVVIIKK